MRILSLTAQSIVSCACSIDRSASVPMNAVGGGCYAVIMALPATAQSLAVEAGASDGTSGRETIDLARAEHFTIERRADGSDADAIEAWPERGILGTQLGPNRNGRHW